MPMVMAAPTAEHLQRLGARSLRSPVQRTYDLADAPAALAALPAEHTQGKLAIKVR